MAQAAAQRSVPPERVSTPIRFATVGVADLAATSAFYERTFGWAPVGEVRTPVTADLLSSWGAPHGLEAVQTVLGPPGVEWGLLRLVETSQPGEPIRDYTRVQDPGFYALNVRVADAQRAWDTMLANGARGKSEPTYWEVRDDLAATDSQCFDPAEQLLDVFEIHGDALGPLDGEASSLQTMALRVADATVSTRFYGALGFETLYDRRIDHLGEFFHLPDGVVMHNVNLHQPDLHPDGRIELAGLEGFPGTSVSPRAAPPNLGMWSITLLSGDLARTAEVVAASGGAVTAGPTAVDVPTLGRAELLVTAGPDGETIEFVRLLDDR